MKIIIVILFTFISLSSVSAKKNPNQDPTGTYTYTIDEVYNELDIFEMDTDTLSINDIKAEVLKKKLFANVEVDIQIVQLWDGKFHKVSGNKFNIDEFGEQMMFVRVKVQ